MKNVLVLLLLLPFMAVSQVRYNYKLTLANPKQGESPTIVINTDDIRLVYGRTPSGSVVVMGPAIRTINVSESLSTVRANSCGNLVQFTELRSTITGQQSATVLINPKFIYRIDSLPTGKAFITFRDIRSSMLVNQSYSATVNAVSRCIDGSGSTTYVGTGVADVSVSNDTVFIRVDSVAGASTVYAAGYGLSLQTPGDTVRFLVNAAIIGGQIADSIDASAGVFVSGPLTGSGTSLVPLNILNESLDSARIKNGGVSPLDIARDGASVGDVLKWNGTRWVTDPDNAGGVADGDKGGIDVTSSGAVWTVDTSAVGPVQLASTAVTPGSYTFSSFTVDPDGRITAASSGAEVDGSITNEGVLSVGAGTGSTSIIQSNTSGSPGVTIQAGAGIGVTESGTTITIANSGDTDASNDLTTSTSFSGDVSGFYNNLQIGASAVGAPEISNGSIDSTEIANGGISPLDIAQDGASVGETIVWNGSRWTTGPVSAPSAFYQTVKDNGTSRTQRNNTNFISTTTVTLAATDDAGDGETEVRATIVAASIDSTHIKNRGIGMEDIEQQSASSNQAIVWNGSTWAPTSVDVNPSDDITGTLVSGRLPIASGTQTVSSDTGLIAGTGGRMAIAISTLAAGFDLHVGGPILARGGGLQSRGTGGNPISSMSVPQFRLYDPVNGEWSVGIDSTGDMIFTNHNDVTTPLVTLSEDDYVSFAGGIRYPYVEKSGAYVVTESDYTVNCTAGTFNVTLPTAVGKKGQVFVIKNSGAGTITVDCTGGQTIDSFGSVPLAALEKITVQSTGANWVIIAQ